MLQHSNHAGQKEPQSILNQLLSFEFRYHLKQGGFWLSTLFFSWMSMIIASQRGTEEVLATSAFTITQVVLFVTPHIIFVVCILASSVMLRDRQYQMEPLIFATPIDKFHYLASRYIALVGATSLLFALCLVGMMLGLMLVIDAKLGEFELINYLQPFLVFALPNIILCCSLVFTIGMLTQSNIAIYVGAIVFYVFYMIGSMLGNSPLLVGSSSLQSTGEGLTAIIEPYGIIAFYQQSLYWTNDIRNVAMAEVSGDLLLNRLVWLTISAALFTLTYKLYAFRGSPDASDNQPTDVANSKLSQNSNLATNKTNAYFSLTPQIMFDQLKGSQLNLEILWSKIKVEYNHVVKGPTFIVLMFACVALSLFSVANSIFNGPAVGLSGYYPTTAMMLDIIAIPAERLGMLIAIFYAAELYWHERNMTMSGLIDATPVSNVTFYLAKVIALLLVVFSLVSACALSAIGFQISQDYWQLRLDLYWQLYFYVGAPVLSLCLITLFLQRFAATKAIGLLFGFMAFISSMLVRRAGIEHPLLTPFYQPYFIFSDMADTLYHGKAVFWYNSYWLSLSLVAGVASVKYWLRGNNTQASQLSVGLKALLACFVSLAIICASFIFYQSNIINDYKTQEQLESYYADYERAYQSYQTIDQPVTKQLTIEADFYPNKNQFDVTGSLVAQNHSDKPIAQVLVGFYRQPHLTQTLIINNAQLVEQNLRFHSYLFTLNEPLAPGHSLTVEFTMSLIYNGFSALDGEHYVTKGGAYIEFEDLMPRFGFNDSYLLSDTKTRKEQGLAPLLWPSPTQTNAVARDDWLKFNAVISTEAPQQVVTVGKLQERWQQGGRNYAKYQSEQDIIAQLAIMSAEYDHFEAEHNGVDISIYHSPKHQNDNDDLLDALTYTMDYFADNILAYQQAHFVIAELPYFSSAQSFGSAQPNMYVGVENRFFHLNHQDAATNQHLAGVAHEFGHQYFGFALEPNIIGGYAMLTEVLAEYMELTINESRYGRYANNQVVAHAINRYLQARPYSTEVEQPLYLSGVAPHVYYDKGKQTMHSLMALIGADKINQALVIMLNEHGYPNKPTSLDLLNAFYRVSPKSHHKRIDELFKTVTFHNFGLTAHANNQDKLKLNLTTQKVAIDKTGEHIQPLNETVQIGLYQGYPQADNSNLLALQTVIVTSQSQQVLLRLADNEMLDKITHVMVDPNLHYIDRTGADNVIPIHI